MTATTHPVAWTPERVEASKPPRSMLKLSYTKHTILSDAAKFCDEHGRMPTSFEVHGYKHRNRGQWLAAISDLEAYGYVRRTGKVWSTGVVTEAGRKYLAEHPMPRKREQIWRARGGLGSDGGTRFKTTLVEADAVSVLQIGGQNYKLGRIATKGRHRSLPMRSITLEEGATCPSSCSLASVCYGGSMPFARRVRWASPQTGALIAQEIASSPPSLIRLHTLGDFPSVEYAGQVLLALRSANSAAFGYTHHQPETRIGAAIRELSKQFWNRFSIRTSYRHGSRAPIPERSAVIVSSEREAKEHNAVVCPEQTGKAKNCASCGLCWNTTRPIAFMLHGIKPSPVFKKGRVFA